MIPAVRGPVCLVTEGWEREHVAVARTRGARMRGLRPTAAGRALLISGTTVHAFGMREAIGVVSIGQTGRVQSSRLVAPGTLARFASAKWLLEMPADERPPPVDSILRISRHS